MNNYNIKFNCKCGSNILIKNKLKHYKTKKHLKYINPINLLDNKLIEPNIINKLNDNQQQFVDSAIENCIVIGNPGCGKTKTIIEYCIKKYKDKIISSSNGFLIISFSKKAQLDFITKGRQTDNPKLFNNNNIKTIHSLATNIMKNLFNKSTSSINTIILATYKNLLNESIDNLVKLNVFKNCKFIIIDEAQDINENQYNLIKYISLKLNIVLILVGDPNQNIYQFQGGHDKFLLNHSNKIYNLTENYRSTNQIIDFINYLRPYNNFPIITSAKNTNNDKPLIYCNNIDNILEHIKKELCSYKNNLEDIAIIGPVKLSKYDNNKSSYSSIGLNLICNYLSQNNIKFIKHFKDPEEIELNNKVNLKLEKGHVNLFTSHGSKGLEFKKVLVVNYHYNTFSKKPTQTEYNNFRYLWYVTLSRPIDKLIIYVDSNKMIFPDIQNVPSHLYTHDGVPFKVHKITFGDEITQDIFSITKIINDNNYFNENTFYEFAEKIKYTITKEKLFDIEISNSFETNEYACLYGIFIEKLFMSYYYKNKNDICTFIEYHKNQLQNILFIDKEYFKVYHILKHRGIINYDNVLYIDMIDKNKLSISENKFITFCTDNIKSKIIKIYKKLDIFTYNEKYLIELYDSLQYNYNEKTIFDIELYFYQINNECNYVLQFDFSENFELLGLYFDKLNELSKKCDNFKFQVETKHLNIDLIGIIDILQNNKIIELKFVKNINEKHIIQTILYYNNYCIDWCTETDIEIWNLLDGYKYIINIDNTVTNWSLNCMLCKILNIKMKNNIFMLDLETNTKDNLIPFTEPSNTEIIDRYIIEYNFNTTVSDGLIKNIEPLTTTHITGINNTDLINADNNLDNFRNEIKYIMSHCERPLFIAHNGNQFDFPILYYYKLLDKDNINTLDSRIFIRLFITNKNISNKLIDLYNIILNKNITQSHRAKSDTMLIFEICKKLNLTTHELIRMCN